MQRIRVIPVLLLHKGGLVKSVRFRNYKYVGDPINAVKIFNEKEVDELVVLDIDATREGRTPDISKIAEIAGEAFMPMAYGGGVTTLEEIKTILFSGYEKVIINSHALANPNLITQAASQVGSQSVVVSVDVKKNVLGKYRVYGNNGSKSSRKDPVTFAKEMEDRGAGELIVYAIDRDGKYTGYDYELLETVAHAVDIPVIACGGASRVEDFYEAVQHGASAVAAGSLFVFSGPHRAVLINYPNQQELTEKLFAKLQ